MDEITHELLWKGYVMFGYNINTGRIRFTDGKWGTGTHSPGALIAAGLELIPVHVELENK